MGKYLCFLLIALAVIFSSSPQINGKGISVEPSNTVREKTDLQIDDVNTYYTANDTIDDDDDVYVNDDSSAESVDGDELSGFPLKVLDDEGLKTLMDIEDDILMQQANVFVAKKDLLQAEKENIWTGISGPRRRKRIVPLIARAAFTVGRALFRSFNPGKVSRSGSRITRQYHKPGNYNDAVRDFNRLQPNSVRNFQSGGIRGQTGTMGNHRVTVRDGSSSGAPTLEIRSNGGQTVRKFRYEPK